MAGVRVFWKMVLVICSRLIAREMPVRSLAPSGVFHSLS